jgi:hypothetical protein
MVAAAPRFNATITPENENKRSATANKPQKRANKFDV